MPVGEDPPPASSGDCTAVNGGVARLMFKGPSDSDYVPFVGTQTGTDQHVAIVSVESTVNPGGPGAGMTVVTKLGNGTEGGASFYQPTWGQAQLDECSWNLQPLGNATCTSARPLPPSAGDTYEYTDPTTECVYDITLQGFAQESQNGPVNPVWQVQSKAPGLRSGGRIGGCDFSPTIYMPQPGGGGGSGGGGGVYFPVPDELPTPGDGVPWWVSPLLGALGGAALNQLADAIDDLLVPEVGEAEFTLTAPCNKDAQGNPEQRTWQFPAQRQPARVLSHQVALMEIMQQHLDWKTPICNDAPTLEGDFRTISFRSDETSPYGKSRLRKRFRYRAVSGNDLSAVVDHWKDFTWEGGPYRVRWVGSTWRTPEVWAASEAEGQRVIQHAAREAGFDPLEGGEWRTRLSSSTRLGVMSNFRVDTTGGYYWITARDGSDGRPIVALT